MLAEAEKYDILATKSLRIFITLIWSEFQGNIIKYIFIPYIIQMVLFIYTTEKGVGKYLSYLIAEDAAGIIEFEKEKPWHEFISILTTILWLYFSSLELYQIARFRLGYLQDPWNYVDFSS